MMHMIIVAAKLKFNQSMKNLCLLPNVTTFQSKDAHTKCFQKWFQNAVVMHMQDQMGIKCQRCRMTKMKD